MGPEKELELIRGLLLAKISENDILKKHNAVLEDKIDFYKRVMLSSFTLPVKEAPTGAEEKVNG